MQTILGSEMIDNININTKRFDFEVRVLIGWLSQCSLAGESERVLQSQTFLYLC